MENRKAKEKKRKGGKGNNIKEKKKTV